MCAQAEAEKASVVLPSKVHVRNKKDQLFNDILQFVETEGLVWKPSEVDNGTASNSISTTCVSEMHYGISMGTMRL